LGLPRMVRRSGKFGPGVKRRDMIEKVLPDVYRIEVPLTGNPMRTVNSYLLKGGDRDLVIDTGWNHDDSLKVMTGAMADLEVDPSRTDFFLTHMHVDHIGLIGRLVADGSRVYLHRKDALWIGRKERWGEFRDFARVSGFPEGDLEEMIRDHPGFRYGIDRPVRFLYPRDGDEIQVGRYRLVCMEVPGHSPGHTCLYEKEKKFLVSGDHLLEDITPAILLHLDGRNPLAEYLSSLSRMEFIEVDLVLPGHRRPFRRCRERIEEIKVHHRKRTREVLEILGMNGPQVPYSVASSMTWDIFYNSWEQLPPWQRWFAVGEANAHLKYLVDLDLAGMENRNGLQVYYRSVPHSP